jgi:5-methylcytosine-specific restriction enzyme subunit McrC
VIIDTKFTSILTAGQHGGERFKTGHLYQLYAYLRSQERTSDPLSLASDGMLLYPAVGVDIDETVLIQGHRIRFVTINLSRPSLEIIEKLRLLPSERPLGTA